MSICGFSEVDTGLVSVIVVPVSLAITTFGQAETVKEGLF